MPQGPRCWADEWQLKGAKGKGARTLAIKGQTTDSQARTPMLGVKGQATDSQAGTPMLGEA
eukprot:10549353-Alexandrium_andersonii.AAC.1